MLVFQFLLVNAFPAAWSQTHQKAWLLAEHVDSSVGHLNIISFVTILIASMQNLSGHRKHVFE